MPEPETTARAGCTTPLDAGQTWQLADVQDGPNQALQAPGRKTGVMALAVVWNPMRQIFVAALRNHGFYIVAGRRGVDTAPEPARRCAECPACLQVSRIGELPHLQRGAGGAAGSGDMFAVTASQTDADNGLWEDVCGASGGTCSTPLPVFGKQIGIANALETSQGVICRGEPALGLAAIPSGSDTLLFAGRRICFAAAWRQDASWRNATNVNGCAAAKVGPNQHGAAWVPNTTMLFFANDRGLWRSRDAVNQQQAACSADDAAHFDNLNGTLGSLAEVTSLLSRSGGRGPITGGDGRPGYGRRQRWRMAVAVEWAGRLTDAGWGANAGTWFATSGARRIDQRMRAWRIVFRADFGTGFVIGNGQVSGDGSALSAPAVWTLDPERSDPYAGRDLPGVAGRRGWNELERGECAEQDAGRQQRARLPVEQHAGARAGRDGSDLRTRRSGGADLRGAGGRADGAITHAAM